MNNTEKMRLVGEAVYGTTWQSALSRALGINDRTIRRFASGASRTPVHLSERLIIAMEREMNKIKSAIEIINSDKIRGDDVTIEVITEIVDRYEYADEQDRKAAIDAINNSVCEVTFLSDLETIAKKFSV